MNATSERDSGVRQFVLINYPPLILFAKLFSLLSYSFLDPRAIILASRLCLHSRLRRMCDCLFRLLNKTLCNNEKNPTRTVIIQFFCIVLFDSPSTT